MEVAAPRRLGIPFRWLLASSWVSNLGDGMALAAGPLLVASQTSDPLLVAMAALLQQLPWLLFGLFAGVLADRVNRRLIVVAVDLARAGVFALLALSVLTGTVSVGVVLGHSSSSGRLRSSPTARRAPCFQCWSRATTWRSPMPGCRQACSP